MRGACVKSWDLKHKEPVLGGKRKERRLLQQLYSHLPRAPKGERAGPQVEGRRQGKGERPECGRDAGSREASSLSFLSGDWASAYSSTQWELAEEESYVNGTLESVLRQESHVCQASTSCRRNIVGRS